MTTTNDQPPQRHVAVCAFPFGTHAAPLLLLVNRLAAATPAVRYTFLNIERSNASLFKVYDVSLLPNIVPCNITLPDDQGTGGNPVKAIEHFIEHSPESFGRSIAEAEVDAGVRINCLISDSFLWFCADIAEEKGCSWIPLWTAGAVSLSAHVYTDVIRSKFGNDRGFETEADALVDCVPGLSSIRIRDLPTGIVTGDLNSPFSKMLHKMGLMLPMKAKTVIINSFEELSPIVTDDLKSKLRLLCVGPFPLTSPVGKESDPYKCLEWLDKHDPKSVAYVSFGTVATPPPQEVKALAEALVVSGIPFLWSMSDSNKANLPSSILESIGLDEKVGKIVPWAPQVKLLSHGSIGVFVTHCGWNSVMESIVAGVPLICRSMLGDQVLNQRVIESDLKFGVGIEGGAFSQSGTVYALHKVMSSDEGKQMRANVEALRVIATYNLEPSGRSNGNFNTLIELINGS